MTYLEHVTAYFVGLVGKGVSLSSRDLELVRRWEALGLPAPAVCRALRQALRRRGPASRRTALADLEAWLDLPFGLSGAPPPAAPLVPGPARPAPTAAHLLEALAEVGRSAGGEPLREAYRSVYRHVRQDPEALLTAAGLYRLDDLASDALRDALPERERRALEQDSWRRAGELLGSQATAAALDRLASALLEEHLCEKLGLVLPSELVRGTEAP